MWKEGSSEQDTSTNWWRAFGELAARYSDANDKAQRDALSDRPFTNQSVFPSLSVIPTEITICQFL